MPAVTQSTVAQNGGHQRVFRTKFGPDLPVHVHFEEAGTYRLWGQFRLGSGQVITAPFTVQAVDGEVDAARAVRVVGVAPGSPGASDGDIGLAVGL
jgi:hypothetical protein